MISISYVTRAYCPSCDAAIWTDAACANCICLCGGANIQGNIVLSGNAVTDEAAFKAQAAGDINQPVENVEIIAL